MSFAWNSAMLPREELIQTAYEQLELSVGTVPPQEKEVTREVIEHVVDCVIALERGDYGAVKRPSSWTDLVILSTSRAFVQDAEQLRKCYSMAVGLLASALKELDTLRASQTQEDLKALMPLSQKTQAQGPQAHGPQKGGV